MDTNIIDAYITFSNNSIQKYNKWLLEYLYSIRKIDSNLEKIINKTINEYLKEKININQKEIIIDIDKKIFFTQQEIIDDDFNNIKFILKKNYNENSEEFQNYFNIFPYSILIAIELNNWANSITKKISFEEAINKIIRNHKMCFDEKTINQLKQRMPFLKKEYQKRNQIFTKLIEHYENGKIDFDVLKIQNNIDLKKYYLINPHYKIDKIKFIGKRKIETIIAEQELARDILFIMLDKINYETLNLIIQEKEIPNYLLRIPKDTFKLKNNIKKIEKIYSKTNFKSKMFFIISYRDYKKYYTNVNLLNKYVSIIISNLDDKYELDILKNIKFISLNKKNTKDKNLMDFVQKKNLIVFYEQEKEEEPLNDAFIINEKNKRVTKKVMYE